MSYREPEGPSHDLSTLYGSSNRRHALGCARHPIPLVQVEEAMSYREPEKPKPSESPARDYPRSWYYDRSWRWWFVRCTWALTMLTIMGWLGYAAHRVSILAGLGAASILIGMLCFIVTMSHNSDGWGKR